jgi:hypothetical protein
MGDQLLPLPLIERTVYLCVDKQGYFRPKVLGRRHGWTGSCQSWRRSRTVIPKERLLPASFRPSVQTKCRAWRRYYRRWRVATRERLDLRLLEVMPPLGRFAPVIDKTRYSAFAEPRLVEHLRQHDADRLGILAHPTKATTCSCGSAIPDIRSRSRLQTPRQSLRGGNDFQLGVKPLGRAD